MQTYFLRNLSELAHKRAINIREEAALWDILARDLKREAGRVEEQYSPRPRPRLVEATSMPPESHPDKLYVRIVEASKIMGIGRSSLYAEINAGRLPIKKAGRKTLIAIKDIRTWFEQLPSSEIKSI